MSDATTLLFGLLGVRVEHVERWADGTRGVHAVTASETAAACPACGVVYLGKGSCDDFSVRHPLRTGPNYPAVDQDAVAVPERLLRARVAAAEMLRTG
jgi:hypothetical protein